MNEFVRSTSTISLSVCSQNNVFVSVYVFYLCRLNKSVAMNRKTIVHDAEMMKPMATSKWCNGSQPRYSINLTASNDFDCEKKVEMMINILGIVSTGQTTPRSKQKEEKGGY